MKKLSKKTLGCIVAGVVLIIMVSIIVIAGVSKKGKNNEVSAKKDNNSMLKKVEKNIDSIANEVIESNIKEIENEAKEIIESEAKEIVEKYNEVSNTVEKEAVKKVESKKSSNVESKEVSKDTVDNKSIKVEEKSTSEEVKNQVIENNTVIDNYEEEEVVKRPGNLASIFNEDMCLEDERSIVPSKFSISDEDKWSGIRCIPINEGGSMIVFDVYRELEFDLDKGLVYKKICRLNFDESDYSIIKGQTKKIYETIYLNKDEIKELKDLYVYYVFDNPETSLSNIKAMIEDWIINNIDAKFLPEVRTIIVDGEDYYITGDFQNNILNKYFNY